MVKLKKIGVVFSAKLLGIYGAGVGLILGILYSFGGAIIDTLVSLNILNTAETPGLSYGTVLAFGALIGMPLISAAIGLVGGAIGACLYNFISKRFGGIEIDIQQ